MGAFQEYKVDRPLHSVELILEDPQGYGATLGGSLCVLVAAGGCVLMCCVLVVLLRLARFLHQRLDSQREPDREIDRANYLRPPFNSLKSTDSVASSLSSGDFASAVSSSSSKPRVAVLSVLLSEADAADLVLWKDHKC